MGVYSLNYHKTIHCGEGGVVVTDDPRLAERLQLIRNHAEAVVKAKGVEDLVNLVGFNYRMTEIEAAIAHEQLKKLDALVAVRQAHAARLNAGLAGLEGLTPPLTRPDCSHGWYVYPLKIDAAAGVPRARLVQALRAEGLELGEGYVEPLYLQPLYQQKIAFGRAGFPFRQPGVPEPDYRRGLCPVTERMHFEALIYTPLIHASLSEADIDDVIAIFHKVWAERDALRDTP
jgi:dTDP-4-amino-4,6-dideoxygalactose transaminase